MSSSENIEGIYPLPPAGAPADLAKPTPQYRRHAWFALLGLGFFALLYIALTGWFCWSAYRLLFMEMPVAEEGLFLFLKGAGSAILGIFMLKGLFFKKRAGQSKEFEIKRAHEPRLFAFLDRLADETGAPRPHRVFLSHDVNACVFYDLSILNSIFPSRKNLNIGLGLVNVLSLSEFKAVLAHEFGHFAQSSMAVGNWVYVARQVATQLIYHRDMFDGFLNGLSRFDLRVAWIGWILRLVVWSIRSILDTTLSLVMLADRALSREMEFQADLVAVKTTGSDALIHALYRLSPADAAWRQACGFVGEQLDEGHKTLDLFAIQSRILEHRKRILNDPDYGSVPPLPESGLEQHRIFTAELAQPPQMWSTHPHSHLRENNAKKRYVPAELHDESAWAVFENPEQVRSALSAHLVTELDKPMRPLEESIAALDKSFDKHCYDPSYRGVYLGRSIVNEAPNVAALFSPPEPGADQQLYPEQLTDLLEKDRNLQKEKALLEALRSRSFEPADGVIRFRGEVIRRRDLGDAIETATADLEESSRQLGEHDRICRCHHLGLAQSFGKGWPNFLKGTVALLHYSEHVLNNLVDAEGLLTNTFQVVIADGNVTQNEMNRLVMDASEVHRLLGRVYRDRMELSVDSITTGHLSESSYNAYFEEFRLPQPSGEIMQQWLEALDSWSGGAKFALEELRAAALETLLDTEKSIARHHSEGTEIEAAPQPSRTPHEYATLLPHQERQLQTKLNLWDSFQTASGIFPSIARFATSAAIVYGAIKITLP